MNPSIALDSAARKAVVVLIRIPFISPVETLVY